MTDKLIIFDTTLRDGEQSPGASMTREEKLRIARQLERMKVDVMEGRLCCCLQWRLRRPSRPSHRSSKIRPCVRWPVPTIAISPALLKRSRALTPGEFTPSLRPVRCTWKKLRMSPEQVLEQAKQSVRFARNLTADVEFSAEDGYRSEIDFLARVCEAVIAEGRPPSIFLTRWVRHSRVVRQLHQDLAREGAQL